MQTVPTTIEFYPKLGDQISFETLIAELLIESFGAAGGQFDAEVVSAIGRVVQFLGVDQGVLTQWGEDRGRLLPSYIWTVPGGASVAPVFEPLAMPWVCQRAMAGEVIAIASIDELPDEAEEDKTFFRRMGVRSFASVPLECGGRIAGVLIFMDRSGEVLWADEVVRRLLLIARVFGSLLNRNRQKLELEERLELATEAADMGLWSMELETRQIWGTEKTREMLGLAREGELTEESYFARIHPEDREAVRQAMQQAIRAGACLRTDYRIVLSDGSIRWVTVRGRSCCDAQGKPERLMGVVIDITERKRNEAELCRTLQEVKRLQSQLQEENACLRREVQTSYERASIVGTSDVLIKVMHQAERVAGTDSTVLILGETGTGKELLAQHIHRISGRSGKAFVTTSIAAIPSTLLEGELFGREKGAYTGALTKEVGRFEMADGGTLFLDEIGEMPLETQSKLLRVLQAGELERLGSGRTLRVDVRVIAATNRNPQELIKAGAFREDLFYRLNVFPVTLPPLRNRREDIPLIVWEFVRELSEKMCKPIDRIRKKDMEAMQAYDWPGNIRELRNIVERSMILTEGTELRLILPDGAMEDRGRSSRCLADIERQHIQEVLESARNRIYGPGGAAEILGIKPTTLYSLMARLGISRKEKKGSERHRR